MLVKEPTSRRDVTFWLRWLAFIPAALVAAQVSQLLVQWVVATSNSGGDQSNPVVQGLLAAGVSQQTVSALIGAVVSPATFIGVGAAVAPSAKRIATVILVVAFGLSSAFGIWILLGDPSRLEALGWLGILYLVLLLIGIAVGVAIAVGPRAKKTVAGVATV